MEIAKKLNSASINAFAENSIEKGASISSDGSNLYLQLEDFSHTGKVYNPEDKEHLVWLHTIISNAKAFIQGTYHGLDEKHLDLYLAEFCFRFNRRFWPNQLYLIRLKK